MAEVAVALRTQHFGADHAMGDVALLVDMVFRCRRGKARPAAAGIELGVGFEQRLAAAGAAVAAAPLLMLVFAGERPLGGLFAQHSILHRRQFLAPLGLALLDFARHRLGVGHGASLPFAKQPSVGDLGTAHQRRLLGVTVRENLLQVLDLRNVVIGNIGLGGVQRQVVLMIGLGRKKPLQRADLGHDRLPVDLGGVELGYIGVGHLLLLVVSRKDRRAILR